MEYNKDFVIDCLKAFKQSRWIDSIVIFPYSNVVFLVKDGEILGRLNITKNFTDDQVVYIATKSDNIVSLKVTNYKAA